MELADRNLVLIGMPGAGKTTVGEHLARALGRPFVDTDKRIESAEGKSLQAVLDAAGRDAFLKTEQKHVCALDVHNAVIGTGGSVPYSERAMMHLAQNGVVVFLYLPLEAVRPRLTNFDERGLALRPDQTFDDLYEERQPLYRRHADITVDCTGLTAEETVAAVLRHFTDLQRSN